MTPADLLAWRKQMGFTQAQAATALGITRMAYARLENGQNAIDKRTGLACAALSAGIPSWVTQTP